MRARRTHAANRDDYDSFDQAPPEFFDPPAEVAVDEAPEELAMPSGPALVAPVHACLVCGDDPAIDSGCPHFEVMTVSSLTDPMLHTLAALRAQHEALRDELRALRRLSAAEVARGHAAIEVREPPAVAPRVVLIPPPAAKRPRRPAAVAEVQGRFGFVEPAPVAQPAATEASTDATSPSIT